MHTNHATIPMAVLIAALLAGCVSHRSRDAAQFQTGESIVLAGEEPAALAFLPQRDQPVAVRSTYRADLPHTMLYEVGRDFLLADDGQIRRARGSRIPDFRTNVLFGKTGFRHDQFPGYGNKSFFVYVDYAHRERLPLVPIRKEFGAAALPNVRRKLLAGGSVRMIAFGDSITAGGEASESQLIFWERWAASLRRKYPRARIEAINGATGGDTTIQGVHRLQEKVLAQKPDMVLIGFGMNDNNREGHGVPLASFSENLRRIVDSIRAETSAEIVMFSAFPPNPQWHYGSPNMAAYAAATEQVACEKGCAFADVYRHWLQIAARKKPEDLLANNINHPNDFGHWIYFQAFEALGL